MWRMGRKSASRQRPLGGNLSETIFELRGRFLRLAQANTLYWDLASLPLDSRLCRREVASRSVN